MFDYTKAACRKIQSDFKALRKVLEILIQIFYIVYIIYALTAQTGNPIINICFLVYSLAYFGLYIYVTKHNDKKTLLTIFKWVKRSIKLVNLVIMLYGLAYSIQSVSPLTIVFSSLTIVAWFIDILLAVVGVIIDVWLSYLFEGLDADLDNSVVLRRLIGHEVNHDEPPSEKRKFLETLVEEAQQKKKQKKIDKKEKKKQDKKDKKKAKRRPSSSAAEEVATSKTVK